MARKNMFDGLDTPRQNMFDGLDMSGIGPINTMSKPRSGQNISSEAFRPDMILPPKEFTPFEFKTTALPKRPEGWNHDPLPGENTKLSPFMANTLHTLSTPLRAFFDAPFNQRAGQTGAEILTGVKQDKTSTGSKGLDVTADLLGGVMGFGANPGGAANLGKSLYNVGENALGKALPTFLKKPAQTFGKQALGTVGGSLAYEGGNQLVNNDPITAKDFAINAGANVALDLLPLGIGKGLDIRADKRLGKQVDSLLPKLESNPLKDIQNAYKKPSLHDVKQKEYEQIFSNPNPTLRTGATPSSPSDYFRNTADQKDFESLFGTPIKQYSFKSGKQKMYEDIFSGKPTPENPAEYFGKVSREDIESVWGKPLKRYSVTPRKQAEYSTIFSGDDAYFSPKREAAKNNATPEMRFGKQSQEDVEAAFLPRKIDSYSFTSGEQRALEALNDGIQKAQNHVGHYDLSSRYPSLEAAYADIKANTGVDLPRLQSDYQTALNRRTSLEGNRGLARAAGVVPDLKPRETPLPLTQSETQPLIKPMTRKFDPSNTQLLPRDLSNSRIGKPYPFDMRSKTISETSKGNVNLNKTVTSGQQFEPRTSASLIPQLEPRQWTNADQIKARSNPFNPFDVPKLEAKKVEPPLVAKGVVKQAEKKLEQTAKQVGVDYSKIKDITGFEGQTKDVYRILEKTVGKEFADNFMKSFDASKGSYVDMQNQILTDMKKSIVDGLGIKKGSKESELVQKYGEKLISEEELKKLSPDKWQSIVRADMWFRETYDKLIDQINDVKRQIYPNAETRIAEIEGKLRDVRADKTLTPAEKQGQVTMLEDALESAMRGKFIPKRADYYRHFQELSEGLSGLKNIFDNPVNINPTLVGKTQFTKPKSKWASIAQKRLGGKTEYDAVGGFLNYLPQAAYAVHIDPQISRFRGLADEIAEGTKDTRNANNLIEFLQDYSNDLSGKTNSLDRYVQKVIPGGRTTIKAMDWLQNRIKANMILGNFGSAVSQAANIPNGIAFAKQHSATGAAQTMRTLFNPSDEMKQSNFLKERWGGVGSKVYRQFDESLLKKPKEAAVWLLETADKIGTQFVWNSAYAKGVAEKATNPIQYADDATRKLIAGRGIGEVPLMFKSKSFGWVAPFQLEVGNLWHVQKDMLDKKDLTGLAVLYASMFAFNKLAEQVKGYGVTFDPIQAVIDASQPNLTPAQRGGRLAGEVFSNVPLGQNIAKALVPEYGGEIMGAKIPSRKELFGKNDPTRFGSGNLIMDSISIDKPSKMLQSLVLPFGGNQVGKTIKGIDALKSKGVYNTDKTELSYPVENNTQNKIKGLLFGTSGLPESRNYYDKNRRPLTETQTKKVDSSNDRLSAYEKLMEQRKADALKAKMKELEEARKKASK